MTEAEKDEIARMVLAVVVEVRRAVSEPVPAEPETNDLWVHPSDRWLIRRNSG